MATRFCLCIARGPGNRGNAARLGKKRSTRNFFRLLGLALLRWTQGRREQADAVVAEFTQKFGVSAAYQVAEVHAHRGEIDAAFTWLDRAYDLYDPGIYWVKIDFLFAALHADPRWPAYLRKLGFELQPESASLETHPGAARPLSQEGS